MVDSFSNDTESQTHELQDIVESCEEMDVIDKDVLEEDIEEDDGEVAEDDDEDIEGVESPQKKCAQVPKKRKFAASDGINVHDVLDVKLGEAAGGEDEEEVEDLEEIEEADEDDEREYIEEEMDRPDAPSNENMKENQYQDELPTSSTRAAANKENTVDEDTCRVCTTKDNLLSIFKLIDQQTLAEMLMIICPSVSIARKDFMPQYLCQQCSDNVIIAVQLKSQCESTERELRKKLSRHKNKVRRPSGYVVIDAPVESDPEEDDDEPADDVEFKVSDVEVSASADETETDTDDSDFNIKKKRRGGAGKRGRRKSAAKDKKNAGRAIKRALNSSDDEFNKKKNNYSVSGSGGSHNQNEFPCDECEQVFSRKLSLVLHKKTHSQSPPIVCKLCGKHFKILGAYRTHMDRHKNDTNNYNCSKCDLMFTTKLELKKHQLDEHNNLHKDISLQCHNCKRTFASQARLQRHAEGYCPAVDNVQKKRTEYESFSSGRDLFKAVAPLTTTYWSDSFSD